MRSSLHISLSAETSLFYTLSLISLSALRCFLLCALLWRLFLASLEIAGRCACALCHAYKRFSSSSSSVAAASSFFFFISFLPAPSAQRPFIRPLKFIFFTSSRGNLMTVVIVKKNKTNTATAQKFVRKKK
jgi:hypothetical protein